jgi:hypothetical protein
MAIENSAGIGGPIPSRPASVRQRIEQGISSRRCSCGGSAVVATLTQAWCKTCLGRNIKEAAARKELQRERQAAAEKRWGSK